MADRSLADDLLDELLPERLEWRKLVDRYPRASLGAAALVGFWLGRHRGGPLLGAVGTLATAQVGRLAGHLFD